MSNDLVKHTDYDALDFAIGSDIDGDPLRFKDGVFLRGFDKTEVEEGTTLRIAATSVQDGFVKWEDGKPVDWRLREWINRDQLPIYREALGDMDKNEWPDGKDPWTYTMLLAVKDEENVQLKFSTSSVGGANAVRRLLREWKRLRDKHSGRVPVVSLGSDSYQHKIHRTEVQFPVFEIVGWDFWDEADKALPSYVTPDDPRTQIRDELTETIFLFECDARASAKRVPAKPPLPPLRKKVLTDERHLLNPFDPAALRLDQSFTDGTAVKKLLTTIPVRKPGRQDFVRVHPDADYRLSPAAIIELKDDREVYLVTPAVAPDLMGEIVACTIFTAISRQGVVHLWPIRLPAADGKHNAWHKSAEAAAERLCSAGCVSPPICRSALMRSSKQLQHPGTCLARAVLPELLKIAFRDQLIDRLDHQVICACAAT